MFCFFINEKMNMALLLTLFRYIVTSFVEANSKYAELCDIMSIKSILFKQHRAVTVFERDLSLFSKLQLQVMTFYEL